MTSAENAPSQPDSTAVGGAESTPVGGADSTQPGSPQPDSPQPDSPGSDSPAGPEARRATRSPQTMKPATAAAKLGVYLPATPPDFQRRDLSREELNELQRTPPPWLVELRREGPHPRSVVAARLRISTSGLARHGLTDPLTTAQIEEIIAHPPEWLSLERASLAEVKREERRLKERDAQRRAGTR